MVGRFSKRIHRPGHGSRHFPLEVESLEDRSLPAVTTSLPGPVGVLHIVSDGAADQVIVGQSQSGHLTVIVNGTPTSTWDTDTVTWIRFEGNGGNDYFFNSSDFTARAYGGSGHDTLVGGTIDDDLYGEGGNDHLIGSGGGDALIGGLGNDTLDGGNGNDFLYGDGGADVLLGGASDDLLVGGDDGAVDSLTGGTGADSFVAEWYWSSTGGGFISVSPHNRELFTDFSAGQGDQVSEWWYL